MKKGINMSEQKVSKAEKKSNLFPLAMAGILVFGGVTALQGYSSWQFNNNVESVLSDSVKDVKQVSFVELKNHETGLFNSSAESVWLFRKNGKSKTFSFEHKVSHNLFSTEVATTLSQQTYAELPKDLRSLIGIDSPVLKSVFKTDEQKHVFTIKDIDKGLVVNGQKPELKGFNLTVDKKGEKLNGELSIVKLGASSSDGLTDFALNNANLAFDSTGNTGVSTGSYNFNVGGFNFVDNKGLKPVNIIASDFSYTGSIYEDKSDANRYELINIMKLGNAQFYKGELITISDFVTDFNYRIPKVFMELQDSQIEKFDYPVDLKLNDFNIAYTGFGQTGKVNAKGFIGIDASKEERLALQTLTGSDAIPSSKFMNGKFTLDLPSFIYQIFLAGTDPRIMNNMNKSDISGNNLKSNIQVVSGKVYVNGFNIPL